MPTIQQLPIAVAVSETDEIPIAQGGVTNGISVAALLAGSQPAIIVQTGNLIGRNSLGAGAPEQVSPGTGVALLNGQLTATGADHTGFPVHAQMLAGDQVVINSANAPALLPAVQLRGLFAASQDITISPTGTLGAGPEIEHNTNKNVPNGYAGLNASGNITAPSVGDVSLATFLPPGGLNPIQIGALQSGRVDIRAFGAVLDGMHDDSQALANAALALSGTGRAIYIPAGYALLMGGAAQVVLNSVAIVGDRIEDAGFGNVLPTGPNATPQVYGQAGSHIFISDTAKSPFLLGHDVTVDGINFLWPDQVDQPTAPTIYPALFSQIDAATNVARFNFCYNQVTNAFDFIAVPNASFGDAKINCNRIYSINKYFSLPNSPSEIFISDNLFSTVVYSAEIGHMRGAGGRAGSAQYLLPYTATSGAWLFISGNGSPTSSSSTIGGSISASNNYVFQTGRGIWVAGGNAAIINICNTSFDGVPTVIQIDPGGTVGTFTLSNAIIFAEHAVNPGYIAPVFLINNPSPAASSPSLNIILQGLNISVACGSVLQAYGPWIQAIQFQGCRVNAWGHATGGPTGSWAIDIHAPNSVLAIKNNQFTANPSGENGCRIQSSMAAAITGNTWRATGLPLDIETSLGSIGVLGDMTSDTMGGMSLSTGELPSAVCVNISGNVNAGDIATIIVTINGNASTAAYTILSTDNLSTIAGQLTNSVNSIASVYESGVWCSSNSTQILCADPFSAGASWETSVSTSAQINLSLSSISSTASSNLSVSGNSFDKPNYAFDPTVRKAQPGATVGIELAGSATTFPTISTIGGVNSNLLIGPGAGTGHLSLVTNGALNEQVRVIANATTIDYLAFSGGSLAVPPLISVQGPDANAPIQLAGRGIGTTFLGSAGSTGSQVIFLGSLVDQSGIVTNPVSNQVIAIPVNRSGAIISSESPISGLTISLPLGATDRQVLEIQNAGPAVISQLAVVDGNNQPILNAPEILGVGASFRYRWLASLGSWARSDVVFGNQPNTSRIPSFPLMAI